MHNLPNDAPTKFDLYQLHKSFGLSIFALALIRLGWRLGNRPPPLPNAMPAWQKIGARMTHWGFYALMVLTPLVGWAMVSVSPLDIPTKLFGIVPIPHLPFLSDIGDQSAAEDVLQEVHELLAKAILALLALHIAAALKHSFVNKDDVMHSMTPASVIQWTGIFVILGTLIVGVLLYFAVPSNDTPSIDIATTNDQPVNWAVDYESSRLGFIGSENGRQFVGHFNDFRAQIYFDAENLDASRVEVIIGTGSATTGDTLRDSTIPEKEWFDIENYPSAIFSSTNLRRVGGETFEALGTLQIKEFTHPVAVSFSLTQTNDTTIANGGAEIIRSDFGLGLNDSWLSDEGVALDVRIEFEIHATQLP